MPDAIPRAIPSNCKVVNLPLFFCNEQVKLDSPKYKSYENHIYTFRMVCIEYPMRKLTTKYWSSEPFDINSMTILTECSVKNSSTLIRQDLDE